MEVVNRRKPERAVEDGEDQESRVREAAREKGMETKKAEERHLRLRIECTGMMSIYQGRWWW